MTGSGSGRRSRNKGKSGEREFAKFCRDRGVRARRGQQFMGDPSAPDVVLEDYDAVYAEVKRCEQLRLDTWMTQAVADAKDKMPFLAHRKNGQSWVVIVRAEDFLLLMKAAFPVGGSSAS